MKKVLIYTLLSLSLTPWIISMEQPTSTTTRHQCSKMCIKGCPIVKDNHSNVILSLKQALIWGNSLGKPCTDTETEGLETLFAEPVQPEKPKKVFKIAATNATQTQYADIDFLLNELEKDLPKPVVPKKVTLGDYAKEINTLIRRAGSQTLLLLKPETTEADINNLDATCGELAEKNNTLPPLISAATQTEKNSPEFLRLFGLVTQATEAAERLGSTKQPLIDCANDVTHPFNSYKNEIKLLQRLLTQNK